MRGYNPAGRERSDLKAFDIYDRQGGKQYHDKPKYCQCGAGEIHAASGKVAR